MSKMLKLLFSNGAATVAAVRVADAGSVGDYQAAFEVLGRQDVQIVVCDSSDISVQQALRSAVEQASGQRKERIAVVGGTEESVEQLVEHAAALNNERMVLVGPDALDEDGAPMPAVFAAAAVAGATAAGGDPAVPINGAALHGLGGLSAAYSSDNDIDTLVRGGVLPLESISGVISPVRGITTRTTTGGVADTTWRELTTILIVDDLIPAIRASLRRRFTRAKNTARSRGAIRSQVIVELEKKVAAEIIDSYGEVRVTAMEEDPTVCLVEFSFAVAHGLNQIYLTDHITV
jgi:phage tail sheath gpL-like